MKSQRKSSSRTRKSAVSTSAMSVVATIVAANLTVAVATTNTTTEITTRRVAVVVAATTVAANKEMAVTGTTRTRAVKPKSTNPDRPRERTTKAAKSTTILTTRAESTPKNHNSPRSSYKKWTRSVSKRRFTTISPPITRPQSMTMRNRRKRFRHPNNPTLLTSAASWRTLQQLRTTFCTIC